MGACGWSSSGPGAMGRRTCSSNPSSSWKKLAALTPRSEINLVLYHGVLAPHARWRPEGRRLSPRGRGQSHRIRARQWPRRGAHAQARHATGRGRHSCAGRSTWTSCTVRAAPGRMQFIATIEDPACHSTDPHPSRTPGDPGRPAASESPTRKEPSRPHSPASPSRRCRGPRQSQRSALRLPSAHVENTRPLRRGSCLTCPTLSDRIGAR